MRQRPPLHRTRMLILRHDIALANQLFCFQSITVVYDVGGGGGDSGGCGGGYCFLTPTAGGGL